MKTNGCGPNVLAWQFFLFPENTTEIKKSGTKGLKKHHLLLARASFDCCDAEAFKICHTQTDKHTDKLTYKPNDCYNHSQACVIRVMNE